MVKLLIYGCEQNEYKTIKDKCGIIVSQMTNEKLVVYDTLVRDKVPELAIVNICTEGGIENAYKVREVYKKVPIMLVSNTTISPMQYLNPVIKPISLIISPYADAELGTVLVDFIYKRFDEDEDGIWIDTFEGKIKVVYGSILYMEAIHKMLNVRLETVEYSIYGSLDQYEKTLPTIFRRCHRSIIVNTHYIDKVRFSENYIRLKNGEQISLSRTYKQNFKEMIM